MERPYRHILVSRDADLGVITMNRPERRNALSEAHLLELTDALRSLADREEVRAIVLAAAGPVYSSGHDFADMAERGLDGMRKLFAVCEEFMLTIQRVPQPVVAQVQGIATAAGCQLVATCDLAVARKAPPSPRPAARARGSARRRWSRCLAPSATSARSSCSSRAIPSTHGPRSRGGSSIASCPPSRSLRRPCGWHGRRAAAAANRRQSASARTTTRSTWTSPPPMRTRAKSWRRARCETRRVEAIRVFLERRRHPSS